MKKLLVSLLDYVGFLFAEIGFRLHTDKVEGIRYGVATWLMHVGGWFYTKATDLEETMRL